MDAGEKPIMSHSTRITSFSAASTAATSPVMTSEPLKRSTKPIATFAAFAATSAAIMAPSLGALRVDQAELCVQIFGRIRDHMRQRYLFSGHKLLYDPLLFIQLNQASVTSHISDHCIWLQRHFDW